MGKPIRIGTRESQLALWQANVVKNLLEKFGYSADFVLIRSEGDLDLKTPLYEMGVQGVFTRSLDIALLNDRIDIAVHSMKDVPTQLPQGIAQSSVLKRGSHKDVLVYKDENDVSERLGFANEKWSAVQNELPFTIATSSIRRIAQWLYRYPEHSIENLRGNINTRLQKLSDSNWNAAIFAAAGLERIGLRPKKSIDLDWMLPAPAQGAIMVVCREDDEYCLEACSHFNDEDTAICTEIEREFLRTLLGGCSTPISALAEIKGNNVFFNGNILSPDGKQRADIQRTFHLNEHKNAGQRFGNELLEKGGKMIVNSFPHA